METRKTPWHYSGVRRVSFLIEARKVKQMRICLACCAGMSTSIVVQKMREAARSCNENHEIWAIEQSHIERNIEKFDVLLIGPQIKHRYQVIRELVPNHIPVAIIDSTSYGRYDGEAVLKQAKQIYEEDEKCQSQVSVKSSKTD